MLTMFVYEADLLIHTIWNTSPCASGLEDIGICSHHNLGHHTTTGHASDENSVWIAIVFLQSPFDHVYDSEGVATAVVCESCVTRHLVIPGQYRVYIHKNA